MSIRLSYDTYYNRYIGCSYFKEEVSYVTIVRNTLRDVIKSIDTNNPSFNINEIYTGTVSLLNKRSFRGRNNIDSRDRDEVMDKCLDGAENICSFFKQFECSNIFENYSYRGQINGSIGCIALVNEKKYVVQFSLVPQHRTLDEINYYKLNGYLYNKSNETNYDLLIYCVLDNTTIKLIYDDNDYTMNKGMLNCIYRHRHKIHSNKCYICSVKGCAPRIIENFRRI